jgi:polysaccharide export outer membrane protein
MRALRPSVRIILALSSSLLASACRHPGKFVWIDEYRDAAPAPELAYVIGPGDVLSIRVFSHEEMSGRVRVRTDGRISLPFVKEVEAAGQTPQALAERLQSDFKEFVNNPLVTVTLEEPKPFTVSVAGEVMRPGVYPIEPPAGVLQALASAGGLSQFAHEDRIYVLRRFAEDVAPVRIRFKYEWLARAEGRSAMFNLQRNDLVVVE